jgi:hypothetical protein
LYYRLTFNAHRERSTHVQDYVLRDFPTPPDSTSSSSSSSSSSSLLSSTGVFGTGGGRKRRVGGFQVRLPIVDKEPPVPGSLDYARLRAQTLAQSSVEGLAAAESAGRKEQRENAWLLATQRKREEESAANENNISNANDATLLLRSASPPIDGFLQGGTHRGGGGGRMSLKELAAAVVAAEGGGGNDAAPPAERGSNIHVGFSAAAEIARRALEKSGQAERKKQLELHARQFGSSKAGWHGPRVVDVSLGGVDDGELDMAVRDADALFDDDSEEEDADASKHAELETTDNIADFRFDPDAKVELWFEQETKRVREPAPPPRVLDVTADYDLGKVSIRQFSGVSGAVAHECVTHELCLACLSPFRAAR